MEHSLVNEKIKKLITHTGDNLIDLDMSDLSGSNGSEKESGSDDANQDDQVDAWSE